jgi:hypothetical protein
MRRLWCKWFHTEAFWPINGHYICPRCLIEHPIPFEVERMRRETLAPALRKE